LSEQLPGPCRVALVRYNKHTEKHTNLVVDGGGFDDSSTIG
jgi:hypothetical protein